MCLTNAVVHFKAPMDFPVLVYFYFSIRSQGSLYLDDIHLFWRTLTYIEVEANTNEGVRHANIDDKEYFQLLVDEVLKADPAIVRRMSQVLEDELHPDGIDIPEPLASPPRKGRPTTSKTLRRHKSAFEYNRSSSRVAVRDLHHTGELVVDLVLDQRNRQLELTLVSTYLVPVFPFCCSN